ncbi:MAG: hypothetical protein ACLVI9_02510 [Anaerostipes hadrus]
MQRSHLKSKWSKWICHLSSNKENGKDKAVSTLKKGTAVSYTNKKLKKKSTYYYKVRAYKKLERKQFMEHIQKQFP